MLIGVRVPPAELAPIDKWIKAQPKPKPTRPEAIRRLVELGLASTPTASGRSKKSAVKASRLAAQTIEFLGDDAASPDEREERKRRLLKGPPEFRDMRAKTKG